MITQPEALRLADILQHKIPSIECLELAAVKLRRLYDESKCAALKLRRLHEESERFKAERDELLEALKRLMASDDAIEQATDDCLRFAINDQSAGLEVRKQAVAVLQARAAIAKVEGRT